MSITLPSIATRSARWQLPASLPVWTREPLLHFIFLGALLFAADHLLASRIDDPRIIVMDAAVDAEARRLFAAARGHEPSAKELTALRAVWLDNEVLYREGLALQVDRGDQAIRERVIFKALSVVDANVKLPPFDDQLLRNWFAANRGRYDEPRRYDFEEAALVGDTSEAAVRSFVEALKAGAPGDAKAGLRVYKGRPRENLVQGYGEQFVQALDQSPPGEWRAQQTRDGWRAIRLDATTAPKPATFEALRGVVQQDWTDATLSEQRSAAVRTLAKKYKLKIESPAK